MRANNLYGPQSKLCCRIRLLKKKSKSMERSSNVHNLYEATINALSNMVMSDVLQSEAWKSMNISHNKRAFNDQGLPYGKRTSTQIV